MRGSRDQSAGSSSNAVTRLSSDAARGYASGRAWRVRTSALHGRPRLAKQSSRDSVEGRTAPVHPDFGCGRLPVVPDGLCWPTPQRLKALRVRRQIRAWSTKVLPTLPSLLDCLSNRWRDPFRCRWRWVGLPCGADLCGGLADVIRPVLASPGEQRPDGSGGLVG